MMIPIRAVSILLSFALGNAAASASSLVGSGEQGPTYSDGYQAGLAAGQQAGFGSGYNTAVGVCQSDPAACSISLGSCLAAPEVGETEPNDNIISADLLLLDTKYWGQSYGLDDADWYYITTTAPNQNLIISFEVPGGSLSGWEISVRDAAGNVFAELQTDQVPAATSTAGDITYRTTLGLVGTYYIRIQPRTLNFDAYTLAALLQESPLETENSVVGFFDAEIEPNNEPETANAVATGVSMYGLINLSFAPGTVVPDLDGDGYEYSQGLDQDWYRYDTLGNEIIALSVCDREVCSKGDWLFQVYDATGAGVVAAGGYAMPLLSVNSDTGESDEFVLGLRAAGSYYLRVTHKRLLTAACAAYTVDSDNDGLPDANGEACGCESGATCEIDILNPGNPDAEGNYPLCPDGSGGGEVAQCTVACLCSTFGGVIETPEDALTSEYNFTLRSTYLPPSTIDSDAYQDFTNRPNPYAPAP